VKGYRKLSNDSRGWWAGRAAGRYRWKVPDPRSNVDLESKPRSWFPFAIRFLFGLSCIRIDFRCLGPSNERNDLPKWKFLGCCGLHLCRRTFLPLSLHLRENNTFMDAYKCHKSMRTFISHHKSASVSISHSVFTLIFAVFPVNKRGVKRLLNMKSAIKRKNKKTKTRLLLD
jgi:hypothetical protein